MDYVNLGIYGSLDVTFVDYETNNRKLDIQKYKMLQKRHNVMDFYCLIEPVHPLETVVIWQLDTRIFAFTQNPISNKGGSNTCNDDT